LRSGQTGQHDGQGNCNGSQFQRLGKGVQSDIHRRLVAAERCAEVEMDNVAQIANKLDVKRLVQAMQGGKRIALGLRRVQRQIQVGRIAGQSGEKEYQHQQAGNGDQALGRALQDIGLHRECSCRAATISRDAVWAAEAALARLIPSVLSG
jgi:DNA-directed RNA polymerase subunit N (RpoN/RPB10)